MIILNRYPGLEILEDNTRQQRALEEAERLLKLKYEEEERARQLKWQQEEEQRRLVRSSLSLNLLIYNYCFLLWKAISSLKLT